jgi:hypothetical protein
MRKIINKPAFAASCKNPVILAAAVDQKKKKGNQVFMSIQI